MEFLTMQYPQNGDDMSPSEVLSLSCLSPLNLRNSCQFLHIAQAPFPGVPFCEMRAPGKDGWWQQCLLLQCPQVASRAVP